MGCLFLAFGFISTFFGSKFYLHLIAVAGGFLVFILAMTLASFLGALKAVEQ